MQERLRSLREERELSISEMARLLGFKTDAAYSKKELGYSPFSLQQAKTIADFFGKTIEEIFFSNQCSQQEL